MQERVHVFPPFIYMNILRFYSTSRLLLKLTLTPISRSNVTKSRIKVISWILLDLLTFLFKFKLYCMIQTKAILLCKKSNAYPCLPMKIFVSHLCRYRKLQNIAPIQASIINDLMYNIFKLEMFYINKYKYIAKKKFGLCL